MTNIYLGNINPDKLFEKMELTPEPEDLEWMKSHYSYDADVKSVDKYHLFEHPTLFMCGSEKIYNKICEIMNKYASKSKWNVRMGVQNLDLDKDNKTNKGVRYEYN